MPLISHTLNFQYHLTLSKGEKLGREAYITYTILDFLGLRTSLDFFLPFENGLRRLSNGGQVTLLARQADSKRCVSETPSADFYL